ncbi:linear amide C-N hydrolase [Ancylobacter sp. SL191]|uniref:linear amide C-N hydrolase n=1 Tax=Ancylobacter sp. SL191 TaxID=2995166 RepID=UPI00226FC5BE|nr:linear amide C-N hydrolase [Ancylobacter sp. SL191]WAC27066.1 linear amide C-N hydrolase [Ancylobacter sp. SL191]
MTRFRRLRRAVGPITLALSLALAPVAQACTSLIYRDANGGVYFGRTLELAMELPYRVAYVPAGQRYSSVAKAGAAALDYTTKYHVLAVTVPDGSLDDLKIVEGFNEKGLTFSLLAFAGAAGPTDSFSKTKAALSAIDLGSWTLGQFQSVAEVKAALAAQPVLLAPLAVLGNAKSPFHYVLHDRSGASIVVEFANGKQSVYDNPVGVMTNGPEFTWHLTNLDNYTFLSNVDQSSGAFGALKVAQPDSGIATAGLPASNTSVGRFVRAVYYSQYAEKVAAPDDAVRTLAHIMNNFDRPKNITIDTNSGGNEGIAAVATKDSPPFTSEYTSWTALTDLNRSTLYLRTYGGLNYTRFDLTRLAASTKPLSIPLTTLNGLSSDATDALLAAKTP